MRPYTTQSCLPGAFPRESWRQIWSNTQDRLDKEIRRRTDLVGIFPDRSSIIHYAACAIVLG